MRKIVTKPQDTACKQCVQIPPCIISMKLQTAIVFRWNNYMFAPQTKRQFTHQL